MDLGDSGNPACARCAIRLRHAYPVDWRSGFIVLTFHNGELLRPQEVQVVREGVVEYRGDRFTV